MILSVSTARSSSKLCQGTQWTPASNLAISRSACSQSSKSLPSAAPEKERSRTRARLFDRDSPWEASRCELPIYSSVGVAMFSPLFRLGPAHVPSHVSPSHPSSPRPQLLFSSFSSISEKHCNPSGAT
jgi:hypothetical protein